MNRFVRDHEAIRVGKTGRATRDPSRRECGFGTIGRDEGETRRAVRVGKNGLARPIV